jgi:predicted transcriptional regulator
MNQQKSIYSQVIYEDKYNSKKKRTELGQLLQIMEYIQSSNNTQISSVARFANMSHEAATRNCKKLVNAGLVVRETAYNNTKYRLTSEGISFLNDCRNFGDILYRNNLGDILYH